MSAEQRKAQKELERSESLLDRLLAFFRRSDTVQERRHMADLNNCFFSPMNCKVAPKVGQGVRLLQITDEEKERLLKRHGHKMRRKSSIKRTRKNSQRH